MLEEEVGLLEEELGLLEEELGLLEEELGLLEEEAGLLEEELGLLEEELSSLEDSAEETSSLLSAEVTSSEDSSAEEISSEELSSDEISSEDCSSEEISELMPLSIISLLFSEEVLPPQAVRVMDAARASASKITWYRFISKFLSQIKQGNTLCTNCVIFLLICCTLSKTLYLCIKHVRSINKNHP